MPWRTCKPMDERLRFIARLLEGEKMAPLCREFVTPLSYTRDKPSTQTTTKAWEHATRR